ncbi:hypothetical protein [Chryseobacterium sp. CFBP8996]|uniref:hypothetical protein n=1 Tax=Chryseobacterium sp. CFBP8996 TaxID=3096529 RepID=UPI002A6A3253|nr:hypothetical protein [Chryseobacterium sp. CFBP8996]MDY0932469.1 hypothetical protein [Chryseobacterium sp. CFBP8996]
MKNKNFIGRLRCLLFLMALASFNYLSAQTGPNDDFDGDGIINSIDIDDDNDGVPDAVESPSCFYSASEWNKGIKPTTNGVVVSSALTTTTGNFSQLLDNVTATTAVTFTAGQPIQNANVYLFTFAQAVRLDAVYLKFNTLTQFGGTTKIQGSNTNNGSDWVDLSAATSTVGTNVTANGLVEVTNSIKYPVTLNTATSYRYIRITGVAVSNTAAQNSSEVYFDFNVANYVASHYPKATCTDANIDGDGILPQFDLDSDGDGCSDAYEAGATTSLATNYKFTGAVGVNGLDNTLETSDNGIVNYTSTYYLYAQNTAMQICKDTDGDGILDINDIDDDNDGVLDTAEQVLETCSGVFTTDSRVIWNSPFTNSNTTATGNATINGTPVSVTATTTKDFENLRNDHWHYGSGTYVGCPDVTTIVNNSVINIYNNDYTVTYTFSRPVRNPSLSFSSFNGTAVLFPHPVYVSGLQGTVSGVSSNSYITSFPATENTVAVIYNGVFNSISFRVAGADAQGSVLLNIPYVLDAGALTYRLTSGSPFGYLDMDTDGDGIVNRLDLDSDGDGCPDAREAGVSINAGASASMSASGGSIYTGGILSGTANAYVGNGTPSQYNANGFFNGIETAAESGIYNGTYTYPFAVSTAYNLCIDTDGDGVSDFVDIDDDNDGVVDAVESPSCFYTSSEWNTGAKPFYGVTISSALTTTTGNFSQLIDGVNGTAAVAFSASPTQAIANANVYLFNFAQPVKLDALYLQFNTTTTQFGSTTKIQGSNTNNGSDWVDLSAAIAQNAVTNVTTNGAVSVTTSIKYPVTLNTATAYKYIRITGVAASNIAAANASEVYFDFNNAAYVASHFPKATCVSDTDGDTIPNHLDLDSDGDGCPDAKEANVSTNPGAAGVMSTSGGSIYTGGIPSGTANAYVGNGTPAQYGSNGLFSDIETGENGIYNSTYTYQYAINNALNACIDTDGDGVGDLIDIDDDNDGILDITEAQCATPTYTSKSGVTVSSTITWNGALSLLVDGADTANQTYPNGTAIAAQTVLQFDLPSAKALKQIELSAYSNHTAIVVGAVVQMQGWNGVSWENIGSQITVATPTTGIANPAQLSYKFSMPANLYSFNKYRIYGVSGNVQANWLQEAYFSEICVNNDTDGDGIPNILDLDSDGDGCPDALEAGVSTNAGASASMSASGGTIYTGGIPSGTANAYVGNGTPSQYGTNGFFNGVETTADSGLYNGTYTYPFATSVAINLCADTDGDGINDFVDIDDDNDGVVDAVESPTCFYTANEWNTGAKPFYGVTISSGLTTTTGNFGQLIDGVSGTAVAFSASPTQAIANANVYLFNFAQPVKLDALYLQFNTTTTQFGNTTKIQGSNTNNGSDWVDLSAAIGAGAATNVTANGAVSVTTSIKYPVTLNTATAYKYIRITGVAASNIAAANASEVYFDFNNASYIASSYSKTTCVSDTDGDLIPNHRDLDSDGDGCSDSVEAGNTVFTSNNITTYNTGTDTNGNGLLNQFESATTPGTINYNSTYIIFATNATVSACLDSDGDTIPDITDIDDDNDGVLDVIEQNCTTGTAVTVTALDGSATGITTVTDDHQVTLNEASTGYRISFPYGYLGFKILIWSIDPNNEFTFSAKLKDGTIVGPINMDLFFSTADPRWVSRWTAKGYPGSDPTNFATQLGEYTGSPFNPGDTYYKTPNANKAWGALSTVLPQATYSNPIVEIIMNMDAGSSNMLLEIEPVIAVPYCDDVDTDNDGIPNRLDLDSDGDGCPDTKEAILYNHVTEASIAGDVKNGSGGAVTSTVNTPNAMVPGPYGSNGFADALQLSTNPDAYQYVYTYNFVADNVNVSTCDNKFLYDIDSDDDGIPDAVESPSCFYTETQAMNITEGVTSDFSWSMTNPLSNTYDDNTTYGAVTPAANIQNKALITFNLPVIDAAFIDYVQLNVRAAFGTGTWRLEGLDVNTNLWVSLSAAQAMNNANSNYVFTNTLQPNTRYYTYRILGVTSVNVPNNAALTEFSIHYKNYNPSFHRTKMGCNSDGDNDGVPDYLDRDSDGDGCPDAVEAGISKSLLVPGGFFNTGGQVMGDYVTVGGNYGDNGISDLVETTPDSGIINYASTYHLYANNAAVNFCTDTDNDSIPDPIDIDDDNDGVLDAVESPSCFYTVAEANVIYRINSQFASPDDDQSDRDIQMLHDGSTALNFNFNAFTVAENATGSNLFTVEYFTPVRLATLVVSNRISVTANANAVVVGSQDGVMWSAALTPATLITAANATTPITFTITTAVPYKFYKIQTGSVPGALATENTIGEITSTLASGYIPSAHPKSEVCLVDTDGDLVPNHLDNDSDNDGCSDAFESGTVAYASANGGTFSAGTLNNPSSTLSPNATVGSNTPADYGANGFYNILETSENGVYLGTYTYANVINALISNCNAACYKPAITVGTVLDTKQGITSLQRAGTDNSNWPMVRKGAWTALESKTKGFVPNRLTVQQIADIPAANLREGMMVYHIGLDCLYINTDGTPTGWKCFNTQTCP